MTARWPSDLCLGLVQRETSNQRQEQQTRSLMYLANSTCHMLCYMTSELPFPSFFADWHSLICLCLRSGFAWAQRRLLTRL